SPIIELFRNLQIRGIPLGPRLAEAGVQIVAAIGASAFGLVGTATRMTLNLTIAFFGLYYTLKHPGDVWLDSRPYIPFSDTNTEKLGKRFKDVTRSEEHTSELQSRGHLVCRLLLEKKNNMKQE